MKESLEQVLKDLNKVYIETEDLRIGKKIIEIDIFVSHPGKELEAKNLQEYVALLKEEAEKYKKIFKDYEKKFDIRFEPFFHLWTYDGFYFLKIQDLYQKNVITKEKFELLKKEYTENTKGDPFSERLEDLRMLYFSNQFTFTEPVIYCGLFNYFGSKGTSFHEGLAMMGAPFMVMSLKSDNFKNVFKHELNHCLGADHLKGSKNIMCKYTNKQKDVMHEKTKKEIKKTLKEKYRRPLRIIL
ncbi:hypothetical protein HY837_02640 [archaeon]|nr:hypothetical protein [archaeon]